MRKTGVLGAIDGEKFAKIRKAAVKAGLFSK